MGPVFKKAFLSNTPPALGATERLGGPHRMGQWRLFIQDD